MKMGCKDKTTSPANREVSDWQAMLKKLGYSMGNDATGEFKTGTQTAVGISK